MRKFFLLIVFATLLSCSKKDKRDYATPPVKSEVRFFTLSEFDPSDLLKPKVTLEITDSTFSSPAYFSYSFLNGNKDTIPDPAFDGYYWTFAPYGKNLDSPAFLTYDYNNAANLASVKPYKIELAGSTEDVILSDTSKWMLVSNYQFDALNKIYIFPVNDFQHIYFLAKKN
jgi:hypothetical protein